MHDCKTFRMKNVINQIDENKKKSVGEQVVASVLDEIGLRYFYDIPVFGDDLRGVKNGLLRFDFCIPFNQANPELEDYTSNCRTDFLLCEYNGIFHYHVIQGKTTRYTLTKQMMNDYTKAHYCTNKKVPILWIPYWYHIKKVKRHVKTFVEQNFPNWTTLQSNLEPCQ